MKTTGIHCSWQEFEMTTVVIIKRKTLTKYCTKSRQALKYFCFCYILPFFSFMNRCVPVREIKTVCFFSGKKKWMWFHWRLSRELTKCFVSGFVSQGQSIQRRPAGNLLCGVCAEDFIWELTPFCGCRSLHTITTERQGERGGKNNIKWKS